MVDELRVYRFNAGSCNGCDIEVVSALAERYGLQNVRVVEEVEEANTMVVVGVVTTKTESHLRAAYEKLQDPKLVIAVGTCAVSSGVFDGSYSVRNPPETYIPVRAYLNGCPPSPHSIVSALRALMARQDSEWTAPKGYRGLPVVDAEKCTACGACAIACPASAIEIEEADEGKIVRYLHDRCISCATCELVCPEDAVRLKEERHPLVAEREKARVETKFTTVQCPVCGSGHITERHLDVIVERLKEKEALKAAAQELRERSKLERTCKIRQLAVGKQLLFKLGYG